MAEAKTLAEALCAAQKQMQNPKKDKTAKVKTRTGGEYTYNYTTLDAVLDVVRSALNDNGVFLSQRSEVVENGMMLQTAVMYGDAMQVLDVTPYQYDTDPQEFGKRETYARRYSLLKAFGLAGDDDTDGDTGAGGSAPPANPRNHPLGNTTGKRQPAQPDKKKWLTRCLQLKAQCMAQGVKESGLDSWYQARFGDVQPSDLALEQVTEWGKYLAQIAKDSDHSKEASNEHQPSDD